MRITSVPAPDLRAHGYQALGQIDHFRLARGVLDDGFALRQAGGHHQVFGAGDGDHVGEQACALQASGPGIDVTVLDADLGAHRLQALDVLVDRPGADGAAAGQRHLGLAAAGHQRAEHQDRGAHGLDQFIGGDRIVQARGIQADAVAFALDLHAHLLQQFQHGADVVQFRDIAQDQGFGTEQRGAEDRQRGVLGAGDGDLGKPALIQVSISWGVVMSGFRVRIQVRSL
jgi:hypothetical protein